MVDRRNATPSWSGYNHQGKVGIFLALKELGKLIRKNMDYTGYKLELEKNNAEDIDISNFTSVVSRHQVKAKKQGSYPNDYKNVRTINSSDEPSGYQIQGTTEQNRFLHVICEVLGWEMGEDDFKNKYQKAKYVANESKVQLYKYPDNKYYCKIIDEGKSPIDDFCYAEIKEILKSLNHPLKDDTEHIEETLFEIKNLVSRRISEAHNAVNNMYPIICFDEINNIVTSQEKRKKQAIRRAKSLFEMYWNKKEEKEEDDDVDATILYEMLNLPDDEFCQLLIDLHPDNYIADLRNLNNLDNLVDKNSFEYILYKFINECKKEKFSLDELRYEIDKESFRLSMINAPRNAVGEIRRDIMKNSGFIKASFHTHYLINMYIHNVSFFEKISQEDNNVDELMFPYNSKQSSSIFSNNLKFIDIENTVCMLRKDIDG